MRKLPKRRSVILAKAIFNMLGIIYISVNAAHAKFDGFYAGGSVGYLQQNTTIDAKQNAANPNADVNQSTAGRGALVTEPFLGWGKVFGRCFYGGVEGKVDWVHGGAKKIAEDSGFVYSSSRKGPGISALARVGYLISPNTLIYGGAGIKMVNFVHNIFEKSDRISSPFSKRSFHLLTEVGVETTSTAFQNLAFRFSYSFMPKRDVTRKTTQFPLNHMYRGQGAFKAGTAEHAVKVGMVYRF